MLLPGRPVFLEVSRQLLGEDRTCGAYVCGKPVEVIVGKGLG